MSAKPIDVSTLENEARTQASGLGGNRCTSKVVISPGANSYVTKPVDLPGFLLAIQRLKEWWFEVVVYLKPDANR